MKKLYDLWSVPVFLCLFACGGGGEDSIVPGPSPEEQPVKDKKIEIALSVVKPVEKSVKATDTGFEADDKVGLFVVNYSAGQPGTLASSGNHVHNMRFTYSSGHWTPDTPVYWKDETTKADFYAYYPYAASVDVSAYPFGVKTDQSALADYKASDLLWGKTLGVSPTAADVNITVRHLMSNALVYISPGDGFTDQSLAQAEVSVKLKNVKTSASFRLETGTPTLTGDAGEIIPYKEGDCYRALLPPQDIAEGTPLVEVTVDGTVYTLKTGCSFATNTKHTLTVKVSKTGSGVNVGIGDWETDDVDHGGTAE